MSGGLSIDPAGARAGVPRATYRLQFHSGFTFADALAIVPYLDRLGISHVYCSPITTARSGSMHGYDVVDPTRINPELGGEAAFRTLVGALRARGMGIIIDIVPNHMGVAGGENAWWRDVQANGPDSRYARFFDVDWREPLMLPVLGDPLPKVLADGVITLEHGNGAWEVVAYGDQRFPIRAEDQAALPVTGDPDSLAALLERQHYRLACWRSADSQLNWRRFFTINDLAGLRIEDPAVFEAVHELVFRLYGEGLIDGVRIDHVDGLTDPAAYCRNLRARLDVIERPADVPQGPAYIVVEKILAAGEPLAEDWQIDGTSGYDFMEQVAAVLHDPAGDQELTALWTALSGRSGDFAVEELSARQEMLAEAFQGQLARCVDAFAVLAAQSAETRGIDGDVLHRAIERLLWAFPVYRTYGTGQAAPASDARIRSQVRSRVAGWLAPAEQEAADAVLRWLAGEGPGEPDSAAEAVRRFQQLSAPIAAKAVEDTAFYRYGRLLSRNDVGFDADCVATPVSQFHTQQQDRARAFPHAMLATATHDHKRGEDVRARLTVLSQLPQQWALQVADWERFAQPHAQGTDAADRYMLYQTLFGAWPRQGAETVAAEHWQTDFAIRVKGWQEKALREARLRSSWHAPDTDYEARMAGLVDALLDPAPTNGFVAGMQAFVERTGPAALANSLAQVALHLTVPGVPDIYQGCEAMDLSLVDPDNRAPVDFALRQELLQADSAPAKLRLVAELLALRREHPLLFASNSYQPVACRGQRADHVIAFERAAAGTTLLSAVAIRCAPTLIAGRTIAPGPEWWGDTVLVTGSGQLAAADLFVDRPVFVACR
jgi:(1->4)-alpha-D-glucan 1-alpha-D-glucosylmutase